MVVICYGIVVGFCIYDLEWLKKFWIEWLDIFMMLWCIFLFMFFVINGLGVYDGVNEFII